MRSSLTPATFLLLALLALLAPATEGLGQTPDTTTADGHGQGSWGPIPPPSDSVTAVFRNRPLPLWERVLLVPYDAVGFPLKIVGAGLRGAGEWAASVDPIRRTARYLIFQPTRYKVIPGLQAGGLGGFGGGMTFIVDPFAWPGSRLRAQGSATFPGDRRLHAGIVGPVGDRAEVQAGAGFRRRHNARFFGLGPDAPEQAISVYENEEFWFGASLSGRVGAGFSVEGDVFWSRIGALPSEVEEPPALERRFRDLPAGFGRFSEGLSAGLALNHQTADGLARPTSGGTRRAKAAYFSSSDDLTPDFWTLRVELQQFFSLFLPHQVLALRGFVSWLEADDGAPIPFQRLMTNDDPDLLRGYQDFRWRDRGMAVLSVEYRWPLWVWAHTDGVGIDAYLLSDVGQVFGEGDDLALDNLTTSYGLGFRLTGRSDFLGLLELAWSDENFVVRIQGHQIFQFAKSGMFYGRSRVPNR